MIGIIIELTGGLFGVVLAILFVESNFLKRVKQAAKDASLRVPFNPPKARR